MEEGSDALVAMRVAGIIVGRTEGQYTLVLQEIAGSRRIVVKVGMAEARAIALFMEGVSLPSPLTHELMATIIERLGCAVSRVIVEGVEGERFVTQLVLCRESGGVPVVLDTRISDAVALAVRGRAPIFAREGLLRSLAEDTDGKPREMSQMGEEELLRLREQAVKAEEYERAQEIQNELRRRGEA